MTYRDPTDRDLARHIHRLGQENPTPTVVCTSCNTRYNDGDTLDATQERFLESCLGIQARDLDVDERTGRPIIPSRINVTECPSCDPLNYYDTEPDPDRAYKISRGE